VPESFPIVTWELFGVKEQLSRDGVENLRNRQIPPKKGAFNA
jgi:hypothetical protein